MPRKTKMNSITSPELLAQVNPKNMELLADFLDYLRSVQRSETSIKGYENDIKIAWVWCLQYNDNRFFIDWTKRQIIKYQNWLINENGNSPARVRRMKAALSSLSNFIESILDDEFPDFRNIIKKIENPALQPVREKTVLSDDEVVELLDELTNKGQYEKACFVALGAYGGRRKSELCRFRVDDFDDSRLVCDGALYKSAPILTKGNKYLECYTLAKKFRPFFDRWMSYRQENNIDSDWLFPDPNDSSKHIPLSTINSWSNSISNILGKPFYPHALRHFFTSSVSRAGLSQDVIVEMIGWSSSDMFKIYNDNPKDEQLAMYFKDGDIAAPDKRSLTDL